MKILLKAHFIEEAKGKIAKCGEWVEEEGEAEALIVRGSTKVDRALLERMKKLKLVIRAGVGMENIAREECEKRGIAVYNTPTASSNAVAELTLALLFNLTRKIYKAHCGMKEGKWLKNQLLGEEIEGKTLGIVGYGRIGSRVGQKAKALGMKVIAHTRTPKEGVECVSLERLLEESDIVSIHLPLTEETRGMIGRSAFEKMKKGAYLINTARGAIVDEEALYQACKEKLGGAALDVYSEEPYSGKLRELDNVLLSCHLGGYTREAQLRMAEKICEIIENFEKKEGKGEIKRIK